MQSDGEPDTQATDQPAEQQPLYVDAATRIHKPSRFDEWFFAIEDKVGQGAVGMAICLLVFAVIMLIAILYRPI